MIGYWHHVDHEVKTTAECLEAHLGGYDLVVEHSRGPAWSWRVVNLHGHEIEAGSAPNLVSAELMAEDAAFHIHAPTEGDWIARLL
jgi:hypothetical protein